MQYSHHSKLDVVNDENMLKNKNTKKIGTFVEGVKPSETFDSTNRNKILSVEDIRNASNDIKSTLLFLRKLDILSSIIFPIIFFLFLSVYLFIYQL